MGRRRGGPGDVLTSWDSSPLMSSFLGSRGSRLVPHPPGSFLLPSTHVLCSSPLNQEALGSAIECDHLNSSFPLLWGARAAQSMAEFQPANFSTGRARWQVGPKGQEHPGHRHFVHGRPSALARGAWGVGTKFLLPPVSSLCKGSQARMFSIASFLSTFLQYVCFSKLFNASLHVKITLGIYKCDTK